MIPEIDDKPNFGFIYAFFIYALTNLGDAEDAYSPDASANNLAVLKSPR